MWKAAFQGRSGKGGEGSVAGKPTKDESQSRRKKSHRAESLVSTTSCRDDDRDRERRKIGRLGSVYDSGGSRYENGSSYTSSGPSQYVTAPSSRVGEVRPLTASALRMLPDDEAEWEDDDKDARSERRSKKRGGGDEKRRRSARSEKEGSRSHSSERREKRKESKTTDKSRDNDRERLRREPELVTEGSRAISTLGSFEQFPGQYAGGQIGLSDPAMMSGALPSDAYQHQFPGQDPYARPQMPPSMPSRADSYGHAADYYLDEGQSVEHQPGHRAATPNMLVNPDLHLIAPSSEANPAQDTGHGSAADFYGGKVNPVPYSQLPSTAPTTPARPAKPSKTGKTGRTSGSAPSSFSKPNPSRTASTGVAAPAAALAAGAGVAALSGSSHQHSQSHQYKASSSSYQEGTSYTSKPAKPARHSSEGSAYHTAPSSISTYPPTLPSTNGYGPFPTTNTGAPGRQTNNSSSDVPFYAAAAAGAAGVAAHEYNPQHQHITHAKTSYNMEAGSGYGGGRQGPPRSPRTGPGGAYYGPPPGQNGGMVQMPFHEHKGPLTRLKDGLFNIISTPEDVAKMEMYTEYIGVCKYCFDPRTSAWDAPRVHHYHKRRDSFEDLRRRRSGEPLGRMGSSESLRRQGSTRVDKDNRYYAAESSRRKRESSGGGVFGAGMATAGALAAANALRGDRRDFDDTYSVKSGHRESSAMRRRSRSSSREQRRQSQHGVVRPDRDEFVTVRKKDGSIEKRRVSRKSRSSSRERKSSGMLGVAAAGAALGAAGMAVSSRRHRSRSRSHSPTVLGGFGASDSRSRRTGRRSPTQSSYYDISRNDRPQESHGLFAGFFSPPRKENKQRRNSGEHQKKRKGFFTFSNSSASSSNSDIAFGEGFASRSSLGLSRKSSVLSNRSGRRISGRASRKRSDDHLAATVAGIGATAAALAAAQKGHRISKRTSRPELGRRRDVRHSHADSEDEDWEDELPSDIDGSASVEGGLAYGGDHRRLSGRQSMESIASQSSAGGLGAWGWRWGGKDKKRQPRQSSSQQTTHGQTDAGSFAAPGLAGLAAGIGAAAAFDTSRPMDKPVYLDDTGRPLPSPASTSTASGPAGPMQYVDPAPISDAGIPSRFSSMPGAFDEGVQVSRPGPDILKAPQPISPAQPAFTQRPHELDSPTSSRPSQLRRANSSPTRGHFAQDAALIGGVALATAGAIAGMSSMSGRSGRDKEPSRVSFGFTEEQQAKEDRERRREQKLADEERRRADRTRALKEEADRAAKEARQEEIRRQREEENRKAAELKLERERTAQREAEERAERERQKETARVERERLEQEALDRQAAATAAAAEAEKHRHAREEAERLAELAERERRERNEAYAREQARLVEEYERRRESEERNQCEAYSQRYPSQSPGNERKQWPSARQQTPQYGSQSAESERKTSSGWAPVAVGGAAAATVGAVMAGREHDKKRDREKSRDDGIHDKGHQDHSEEQYGSGWQAREGNDSTRESEGRAELERRASEKYGRGQTGVEVHDGYSAAEIKPKNEHEGEPLTDDDIYDPDFFKKKHTAVETARYAEFARKAAEKVVNDREHAYDDDKRTNYADFFAPKELLAKEAGGKTSAVSPDGDMDVQVFHLQDAEILSSFPSSSDYGYGRGNVAPHGVPRLNVIAPTPPPGPVDNSPFRSKEHTKSPLAKEQVLELANELNKSSVSQSRSEKSERSRSISWGDDSTHYYDVDTPESYHDRDSYITSPDVRNNPFTTAAAVVGGAAVAGAALQEIVVEDPTGGERHYTEEEWLRDEKSDARAGADDDQDVEDITPSPGPEPRGFYRQPFFDSVSDMGTGIFQIASLGTEGAPPVRGFVEGEIDELTPVEEKRPHIPGGFVDDMDDIYRPRPKRDNDPVTAEIEKEQAAAAVAGAAEEVSNWGPALSKKDKKKREKEAKRASSVVESEPTTYYTAKPEQVEGPVAEPAWEPPLSKKEQKKREQEARRQSIVEQSEARAPVPVTEPTPVAEEPAWEPPLSAKEKKKRDKAAKRSWVVESDPSTPVNEPESVTSPMTQVALEPEGDFFLSKKDKKKRDKARKESGDLASSIDQLPSEAKPVNAPEETSRDQSALDDWEVPLSKKDQKKLDKERLADAALVTDGISAAAAVLDSTEGLAFGSSKKKKKDKKSQPGEPSYSDPRDLPSDLPAAPEPPLSEPHGMPGGWDSDRRDSNEKVEEIPVETPENSSSKDAQNQVPEEPSQAVEPGTPAEDDWTNSTAPSKKSKKKSKRNSAAFNIPEISSPLRSEISFDDYVSTNEKKDDPNPQTNGYSKDGESSRADDRSSSRELDRSGDSKSRDIEYFDDARRRGDRSKQISVEDSRSSASDERKSRREEARRGGDYFNEASYAYETASVAATEPIGDYERSSKSKRRSRHADDDDDTRSVVSSRSRRDKEELPSEKKKEKKSGIFGLFGRNKSTDDVKSYKDDTSLSRTSTRDSKRDDEDEGSRHRRKHRSRSEYGDDDDDTKSGKSSSGKSRRHRSEKGSDDDDDDDRKERRRKHRSRSECGDDDDDTKSGMSSSGKSRRHRSEKGSDDDDDDDSKEHRRRMRQDDDARVSPARSEPGHRRHRRHRTDDDGDNLSRHDSRESWGASSEGGSRHHHRRRTDDEDAYGAGSRDQSFLGMRVEEMPPLPVSRPASPDSTAKQQRKGSSAEAESGAGLVTGAAIAAGLGAAVGAAFAGRDHEEKPTSKHNFSEEHHDEESHDRDAPVLEHSPMLETPSRPVSTGRPPSSSAVPLHFPGRAPQTPLSAKDRAHSFSSPVARSPATPVSPSSTRSRQGRPQSTEIRPLYLVERNRQNPEVEDALPSLPSSKPSSRASSIQGSDENYQSAVEELDFDSPNRSRVATLTLDTDEANAYRDDPLGSGEVTPKASEFHSLPGSGEKAPKQEPQFYTWEDFAQDERLHEQGTQSTGKVSTETVEATPGLTVEQDELPRSRSQSPGKNSSGFQSAATAAVLGTAAVYAHHKTQDRSPEPAADVEQSKTVSEPTHDYPLPEPIEEDAQKEEILRAPILESAPPLLRRGSSKRDKSKKGKKQLRQEDVSELSTTAQTAGPEKVTETIASASPHSDLGPVGAQNIEVFREIGGNHEDDVSDSATTEVGTWSFDRRGTDAFLDASSRSGDDEQKKEDRIFPSAAAHTLPSYGDFFSRASAEHSESISGSGSALVTPFMATPTPAEDGIERGLSDAVSKEDEQRPANFYKLPTAKAEPAPLVIEQRNVEAAEPPSSEPVPAPKFMRKQSKKDKKKGKKAMLLEEEPSEPLSEQQLLLDTNTDARSSRESADVQEEPLTAIEKDDAGFDAQPWLAEASARNDETPAPTQISFDIHDFSELAQGTSANWQDTQAQAFQDFMTAGPSSVAPLIEEPRVDSEDAAFEPGGPKKKGKKSKKSKSSSWSEDASANPSEQQTPKGLREATEQVQESSVRGAAIVAGLGAAAAAIGASEAVDKKSKKKAKKDRNRQSASWDTFGAELQPSEESPAQDTVVNEETPILGSSNVQEAAVIPEADFGRVGASNIAAFHNEAAKSPSEQATVAAPQHELGPDGVTDIDVFQRAVEPKPFSEELEPTVADDFPSTTSTKKMGRKNKKNASQAGTSEPASRAESPSASRQMSMDESAFVDAEGSHEVDAPQPEHDIVSAEPEATIISGPEPAVEEDVPFVSGKKSKKDKKKKKSAGTFEAEPETPHESANATVSHSRRASADEAAFVDASEQQTFEDAQSSIQPGQEPTMQQDLPAATEPFSTFEPLSAKKGKKNKKNKKQQQQQQSIDWAGLNDTSPTTPEQPSGKSLDLGPVGAQEVTAFDANASAKDSMTSRDRIDLGSVGAQDTSAFEVHRGTEDFVPSHESVDLGPVGAQDTTAIDAGITIKELISAREAVDLGLVGGQDISAFPETTTPSLISDSDNTSKPVAEGTADDFAPAKSSKKSKKKKKSAAFDWDTPDQESITSTSMPESRHEPATELVGETAVDTSNADVPVLVQQVEQAETSLEPLKEDENRGLGETSELIDGFALVSTSKKSNKDKKKSKSAVEWVEPDVETALSASEPLGDGLDSDCPAMAEHIDGHKPQEFIAEATAGETAVEVPQEDFLATISSKQAKKDKKKKKKKQSILAWEEPEPESIPAPQYESDVQTVQAAAESSEVPSLEPRSTPDVVVIEENQQPPIAEAAQEVDESASFSPEKTKKKKKRQTFNWDAAEPVSSLKEDDEIMGTNVDVSASEQAGENVMSSEADYTVDQPAAEGTRDIPEITSLQAAEPLADAPVEEEFKPTLSRKQSKKDKKKKLLQQLDNLTPDEPLSSAHSEEQASNTAPAADGELSKNVKDIERSSEAFAEVPRLGIKESSDPPMAPAVEVPIEDEFKSSMSRKQSKKDKKKKKHQHDEEPEPKELETTPAEVRQEQQSQTDGPLEEATEKLETADSANNTADKEPATDLIKDGLDTAVEPLVDAPIEDEFKPTLSRKQSKKDKKKKLQQSLWELEPEMGELSSAAHIDGTLGAGAKETVQSSNDVKLDEPHAHQSETGALETTENNDKPDAAMQATVPENDYQPAAELPSSTPQDQPQNEFAQASDSKTKGKKGKKFRQSEPGSPPVLEGPPSVPQPETSQQDVEDGTAEASVPFESSAEDLGLPVAVENQLPTPAAEQDDDLSWAPSFNTKKTGKQGTQDHAEAAMDVSEVSSAPPAVESMAETPNSEPNVEASNLPQEESQRDPTEETVGVSNDDLRDESWGFSTTSKKKSKKGKKSIQSTPATPAPESEVSEKSVGVVEDLPATEPQQFIPAEEQVLSPEPESSGPQPVASAEPQADELTKDDDESRDEFAWALGSKKKGKKGKKTRTIGQEHPTVEAVEHNITSAERAAGVERENKKALEKQTLPSQGMTVSADTTVEDDLWAAPASKKKKGKKGKKSGSDVVTPATEAADPMLEASLPAAEAVYVIDQAAKVPIANLEPAETPLSERELLRDLDQVLEPSTNDGKEEQDLHVESHAASVDQSVQEEPQDIWDTQGSNKKKTSGTASTTPLAEDLDLQSSSPASDLARPSDDVESSTARDLEGVPLEPCSIVKDQVRTAVEVQTGYADDHEGPVHDTFDDVWADEEIATHEDTAAVKELFDESTEDARSSYTPGSKKGKKKNGKKGFSAGITSSNETSAFEADSPVNQRRLAASGEAAMETPGTLPQDDDTSSRAVTPAHALAALNISQEDTPGGSVDVAQSRDTDAVGETMTTPATLDPALEQIDEADLWATQRGSKKKAKKNKKSKAQDLWTDNPVAEPIADVGTERAFHDLTETAPVDEVMQSATAAEPTLVQNDAMPTQQDSAAIDDDWAAPKAGKKRGKKGKKSQPDVSDEPDKDTGADATPSHESPNFVNALVSTAPRQDPTEAEFSNVWAFPTKAKTVKKAKKGKQVLAWDEEEPPSRSDDQHVVPNSESTAELVGPAEMAGETEMSVEAPQEQKSVSRDLVDSSVAEPKDATLEQQAQHLAEQVEANESSVSPETVAATEDKTLAVEEQESDAFFTAKRSEKDKKRAKTRAPVADDFHPEQISEVPRNTDSAEPDHGASLGAAAVATAALAGVVASEATEGKPEEDDWARFSSNKSKRDKKKAKKSGAATPIADTNEPPVLANTDIKDFAPAPDLTLEQQVAQAVNEEDPPAIPEEIDVRNIVVDSVDDALSPRSLETLREQPETAGIVDDFARAANLEGQGPDVSVVNHAKANGEREAADTSADPEVTRATPADEPRATSPRHPSQDIDFTATVAAGLADSGFNPDMVINDPVFQRRASPPGTIPEADPDEVFSATTTKRKKGKKNKKLSETTESPAAEQVSPETDVAPDSVPADDFDNAISQSLQGTGFDPALLEKALASSNDQSSKGGVEDPDEFAFTTSKRKKGTKGKKSQADQYNETPTEQDVVPVVPGPQKEPAEPLHELKREESTIESDLPDSLLPTTPASDTAVAEADMAQLPGSQEQTQPVNILSVGRDEMDMDEMDRQYKEYRKNKRKQKKLRGAARAAGLSDNPESATEQSAMVSESEGLSAAITRDDILPPQSTLDETTRQLTAKKQPGTEVATPAEQVVRHTSSAPSHSIFGERVKRRIPPKPKPEERSTDDGKSSTEVFNEPRPEFGTAGMAAVVAAAARERKARQEASKSILESAKQDPSWSFDALDDARKAENGPKSLDNHERQQIRDSGYQEGTRSPQRASRSSYEVPDIVHTSSSPRESPSKDSLRERRSLEPLKLATSPDDSWKIKNPKRRSGDDQRHSSETHSQTPSAETPLKPTSKDRVSYLFQTPPDGLASSGEQNSRSIYSHSANPVTPQRSEDHDYFKVMSPIPSEPHHNGDSSATRAIFSPDSANADTSRERSALSPVSDSMSPRLALDSIPEERPTSKRGKSKTDLGGPEHIKAVNRAETPQGMRAREQALSPSVRPSMNIPATHARSTSNPLSTDTLINRLSWPDIDEQTDTVHIDRHLGHRHSRPALPDPRSPSIVSNRSTNSGTHFKSPQELRSYSRTSNRSSTPSLRRTSLSGDLRAASRRGDGSMTGSAVGVRDSPKTIPFEAPPTPPPNDDELMTGSASRAMDLNDDVFQGYGDAQQSQVSPTRPPSVRKRQSMHITDLESQLGQLAAENRALREAREYAEQNNDAAREVNGKALQEALAARDQQLQQKDHEISAIKAMLQPLQEEVARLTEVNGGLTEANRNLVDDTNGRYATLQNEHAQAHEQWQSAARELESMRNEHGRITSGMKDIVEAEIATALADKNAEILRLREQLDIAGEQIRALQVQIQSSRSSDWLNQRDEDYFDGSCQKLCQHVQQWVLRFSKLSDNRICRLSTDLNDDKIEARLDNAILDGSDVDKLLGDRVRRRDVFMSVVMTMVWEYVFTRYLFGMDREQRQKLKALEKLLAEVGPPRAVSHWRATTLTLLAKRPSFDKQCTLDTEAVCHEIFGVLCSLLPPPSNSEQQLLASLQKVIGIAVDLSIEMRTQRAEYIMLPPLQPEYDTNGDLVRKVHFNASLMNERSGFFSSNEELAAEHAVVKIVLFPLVVKKGDDYGEGEEEIVVCPAQVLVQNDGGKGKRVVRVMSGAMEIDDPIRSRQSKHSLVSEAPGSVGF